MLTSIRWSSLSLVALAGCAAGTSYLYSPQGTSSVIGGYPTQVVGVPPEAPQGKVEVSSFGVTEISPQGDGNVRALHVRMVVTNDGDPTPWSIMPAEQQVEIAGEGRSRPMYVNADVQGLPTITIAERERRMIDFYYPLPAGMQDDDHLPQFDFLWQVTTAARPYASRTTFDRVEQEPTEYSDTYLYTGWGPYWWYDPFFPHYAFRHYHPIVVHYPGRVIVHRPMWDRRHRR